MSRMYMCVLNSSSVNLTKKVFVKFAYVCQYHRDHQRRRCLVSSQSRGFADLLDWKSAEAPWERFLHYWAGCWRCPGGILEAWVGLLPRPVQNACGRKTDARDASMRAISTRAINNMKDGQNHASLFEHRLQMHANLLQKSTLFILASYESPSKSENKGFEQTR